MSFRGGRARTLPESFVSIRQQDDVELLTRAFGGEGLLPRTMTYLANAATPHACPPGPLVIAAPVDPAPAWYLVRHGTVVTGEFSAAGEFVERQRHRRGQWLDTAGAMSGNGSWLRTPKCLDDVELLSIPVSDLTAACALDGRFALAFGRVLAMQVRELHEDLTQWAQADVGARVSRWLLKQAELHHARRAGANWTMDMRKQDMANHLGTSAESVSRTLMRLSREGYIRMSGYTITMLDLAGLEALSTVWVRLGPSKQQLRAAGR